jgi:signal transduction histidine kinase
LATPELSGRAAEAPWTASWRRLRWSRDVLGARWLRLALWPAGIAAGIGAHHGLDSPDASPALYLVVGWSFIASGLIGWARRPENRIGVFMVAVGFLWFAPELLAQSASSLVSTLGIWTWNAWAVVFVLLLVAFPFGRLVSRLDRFLVAIVLVPAIPMQALWLLFLETGGDPGNAFLVWPDAAVADAVDNAQRVIAIAALAVLAAALVHRWVRASPPLRRVLTPVLAGAGAVILFSLVILLDKIGGRTELLDALFRVVLASVPIIFLVGLLRARLARSAVGDLLVHLQQPGAPGALREALARALHDPSLTLAYWVPEYETYVGVDGRPTELPKGDDDRVATLVERRGRRVAALVHDASLRDEPELVGAVTAAAGIALENEQLQADLRARLEELRGSRARIVEAGDSERRRLERNLHDGAQQRLVSLSVGLRLLASRLTPDSEEAKLLEEAREELRASLEELRELAQGIHPAVLSDHGLGVALESLAARTPLHVCLAVEVHGRLPEPVEVAAYYLVSEGLTNVAKYAHAAEATVNVAREDGGLVVEVVDDGVGGADPGSGSGLRGLADRVEALDGRLRVWSPAGGGTRVRAEIPCA